MFKEVSTNLDFIRQEEDILAFWKDHSIFDKSIAHLHTSNDDLFIVLEEEVNIVKSDNLLRKSLMNRERHICKNGQLQRVGEMFLEKLSSKFFRHDVGASM